MGLTIQAYSKLVFAPNQDPDDEEADTLVFVDVSRGFAAQAAGLRIGYHMATGEDYEFGDSYSGYNRWRNRLAQLGGYAPTLHVAKAGAEAELRHDVTVWNGAQGPFSELINFSDCEGSIGPAVSAKLLVDFGAFREQAEALNDQGFLHMYTSFQRAFALAADDGAVIFC